jgi:16S rRNA (cytosine967-C5)-methyltransferase
MTTPRIILEAVSRVVGAVQEGARADEALAALAGRGSRLDGPSRRDAHAAVMALYRWRGWLGREAATDLPRAVALAQGLDARMREGAKRAAAAGGEGRAAALALALAEAGAWLANERAEAIGPDPWRLFPEWLAEELPEDAEPTSLLAALQTGAPLWVRAQGAEATSLPLALAAPAGAAGAPPGKGHRGASLRPHPRLERAWEVLAAPDLYRTRAFHEGRFEVQDLASQAVVAACDPRPGERWWDACAGAGGKTLALADRMRGKGTILATDPHEGRLAELKRRARRAGVQNARGLLWSGEGLPRAAKKAGFDGVLVDAPCTGSGTWRRNPEARWRTGRDDIARLAALQAKLLAIAARGVRPGGRLVYATCSLARSEDEAVVLAFLAAHPDFAPDPVPHPLTGAPTSGVLRIHPSEAGCDGDAMFVARLARRREGR